MQYLHYCGDGLYGPKKFIAEAKRLGITRRVAANIARGMRFGDIVSLLSWNHGKVLCFGEFVITQIVLDHELSGKVQEKLKADGHVVTASSGSSVQINRECGSFELCGGCSTSASIEDIIDAATEIATKDASRMDNAKDGKAGVAGVFVMIGGKLSRVYDPPRVVSPAPPFSRGYIPLREQVFAFEEVEGGQIRDVRNYQRRARQPISRRVRREQQR